MVDVLEENRANQPKALLGLVEKEEERRWLGEKQDFRKVFEEV